MAHLAGTEFAATYHQTEVSSSRLAPMTDSSAAWHAVSGAAGIEAGSVLLDAGCGTGAFCALAVTWGVAAHGLDADPDRIEQARRRAPAAEFRVGLMEALPWPDDTFDVVTGINAFQYARDLD